MLQSPTTFGGNLPTKHFRFGALRANYTVAITTSGRTGRVRHPVLHPGGLIIPLYQRYLALIHADGAGAIVQNGHVVQWLIALVTPFCLRYLLTASITLRSIPVRCAATPEPDGGESADCASGAGAIARVNFATISARAGSP